MGESPSTQQLTKCRAVENGRRGGMVNEDMVVFGSNIRAQSIRTSRCHGRYIARKEEGGGRKGEHRGRCLLTRDTQAPAMTPLPHATVHAARTRRVVRKAGRRGRRARVAGPCVATPERLHDTSPPRNSTGCADKRCRGWNVCQLLICARTNCVRTSAYTSQGSLPARSTCMSCPVIVADEQQTRWLTPRRLSRTSHGLSQTTSPHVGMPT